MTIKKAEQSTCGKYWSKCPSHCTPSDVLGRLRVDTPTSPPDVSSEQQELNELAHYLFEIDGGQFSRSLLFPISAYDKSDILEYTNSRTYRFYATPIMLHKTFDYYLLSYCVIQYLLHYEKTAELNGYLNDKLSTENEKAKNRRRKLPRYMRLIQQSKDEFQCHSFASNAVQDILCKCFFLRSNATAKYSSLEFHSHFIAPDALAEKENFISWSADEANFDLEDYFYYEYFTGVSLSAEITAALMDISKDGSCKLEADFVWKSIKEKVKPLARSPMFLSRNIVARYYILEIRAELQKRIRQFDQGIEITVPDKSDLLDSCIKEATKRVDIEASKLYDPYRLESFHVYAPDTPDENIVTWVQPRPPICCFLYEMSQDPKIASQYFKTMLLKITKPIHLSKSLQKPKHGPIIFCNEKHKEMQELFDSIKQQRNAASSVPRNRTKENTLFQKVHQEILSSIPDEADALDRIFLGRPMNFATDK